MKLNRGVSVVLMLMVLVVTTVTNAQPTYVTTVSFPDDSARTQFNARAVAFSGRYLAAMGEDSAYFGFQNTADPVTAGVSFPVCVLSAVKMELDSANVIANLSQYSYYKVPLLQNGKLASSIDVQGNRSLHFGYPYLTRQLYSLRDSLIQNSSTPDTCVFLLHVPEINQMFLGRQLLIDKSYEVTPVFSDSSYSILRGQWYSLPAMIGILRSRMGHISTTAPRYGR